MDTVNSDRRLDCVSLYRGGSSEIRTAEKVKTKRDGASGASQNTLATLDVEPTISQHEST
jgi:hypothetical protein